MSNNSNNVNSNNPPKNQLTIVGIGASAGGLAALKTFFQKVEHNELLAYVVVVHLSPEHKSILAELLQANIKMEVIQVTETTPIKPNTVYVIPPNANLNTIDTHLRLSELEEQRRHRAPIDHFFRTLAKTHDGHSIGVILTGTGSDGTLGLREVKEHGGLTIVQDPQDAEFDGMPQSAISTGLVDQVLPLDHIPAFIKEFVNIQPEIPLLEEALEEKDNERNLVHKIFAQVRARTGRDFSRYKLSTILRRIQRRMQLMHVKKLENYLDLLRKNKEEVRSLADDFLINVTNFFRDTDVYTHLEQNHIPRILENKGADESIRIWSVGCATGEEAYSLAILLTEAAERQQLSPHIQVFASDLHEPSLKKAREGYFPGDIHADVSEERLKKFFIKEDGGYRIRKELREMVIFTPHNLMGDPPFSRIDMIVCRNLLIYLKRDVQRDIFELFHYSLRPEGVLVLGSSEHLDSTDLFLTESKEYSIYSRRNVHGPELRLPVFPTISNRASEESSAENQKEKHSLPYGALHYKMVERYAPPSLLLSPDYQLLHLSENAGRYLQHPGGEPSRDIFKLMRMELRMELRTVIFGARERQSLIRSNPISIGIDGSLRRVIISAQFNQDPEKEDVILVLFEDFAEPEQDELPNKGYNNKADKDLFNRLQEMEAELVETRQRLQSIIEEYETSREEMKASNEELQSSNEELRSTLEELETSKEELQSMNEELSTLNQENRLKVEELRQVSSDLQNLLEATDIATLFLDKDMRILRFTPQITRLFNIRLADRGRLISDQTNQLGYSEMVLDAQKVLNKLIPIEKEIKDKNGATYLTRILPYRTSDDHIGGVVITFIDITSRVEAEEYLKQSEEHFRALVEASAQVVWTATASGELEEDSPSWREYSSQTYEEWKGFGWLKKVHPDDRRETEKKWKECVKEHEIMDTVLRIKSKNKEWCWFNIRAVPLFSEKGTLRGYVGMNIDIDQQVKNENAIKRALEDVKASSRAKEEFLSTMSHEIRTPLNAINGIVNLLLKKDPRADQQENLNTLKFSSQSLLMLINDILDFSKIEAGKMELYEDSYSLETLLNSIQHAHTPGAEEKGNDIIFSREKGVPIHLKGDSYKLSQVLNNLIGNANKFTAHGQITVSIKLLKKDKDAASLYFEVSDTGIGISEDKLEMIFEKFTQADSSTVRHFGGTGLGLSITKSLLQMMGSQIKVESKEGKGARFFFKLQQQIIEPDKHEQELLQKEDKDDIQKNIRQAEILLVEDAAINRMIVQQYLKEWWEIEADEAENGHEALKKATNKQYDLILMDIRMPGMSGLEATRQIRQLNSHYQAVPIVAITADVKIHDLQEGEEHLFTNLITKPYEPEDLQQMINNYVGGQKSKEKSPPQQDRAETDGPLPDFEKVERQFADSPVKIKGFMKIAAKELKELNLNFFDALAKQDQPQMSDIIHKARVLFDMLGINSLLDDIRSLREQADTLTAESPAVQETRNALQRCIASVEEFLKRIV